MTLGLLAIVSGVALLGVGGLRVARSGNERRLGTAVIRSQPDEAGGVYDRTIVTPTPVPATPAPVAADLQAPDPGPLRDSPYQMVIDKIGVNAGVVTYGLDANQIPEVPYDSYDVAWYNFSPRPGTGGNAVFAGHVTWNGRAVFYYLDRLAAGDEVRLVASDGTNLRYTVDQVFLVDENDPKSLAVMGPTGRDTMTIITCGGSPYYIGGVFGYDYTHRLVVRASLADVTLVAAPGTPSGG